MSDILAYAGNVMIENVRIACAVRTFFLRCFVVDIDDFHVGSAACRCGSR